MYTSYNQLIGNKLNRPSRDLCMVTRPKGQGEPGRQVTGLTGGTGEEDRCGAFTELTGIFPNMAQPVGILLWALRQGN